MSKCVVTATWDDVPHLTPAARPNSSLESLLRAVTCNASSVGSVCQTLLRATQRSVNPSNHSIVAVSPVGAGGATPHLRFVIAAANTGASPLFHHA